MMMDIIRVFMMIGVMIAPIVAVIFVAWVILKMYFKMKKDNE